MALATLWTVSVGCQAEAALPVPDLEALPAAHVARRRATTRQHGRALSCFRRGRLLIIAALCGGQVVPQGRLWPEPWPKSLDTQPIYLSIPEPLAIAA